MRFGNGACGAGAGMDRLRVVVVVGSRVWVYCVEPLGLVVKMSAMLRWLRPDAENRYYWPHQLLIASQSGTPSTGRSVSPGSSIGSTAVWSCVRIISESIATLPLNVYERIDRGRTINRGHALYTLLHDAPNVRQTAVEYREQMLASLLLFGNSYTLIDRWPSGRARYLWPLRPDRITVRMRIGSENDAVPELVYQYRKEDGTQLVYSADQILHVRGLSADGMVGLSPITVHREAVALEQAEREFAGRFFGNNARPGGVLKTAGKLSPDAAQRLKATWEGAHRGLDNAHRVAILEEGLEWQAMSMPLSDAQFVEQRRFSLEEIARIFRVPLHLVNDLQRSTFSNIEHQGIEFVTHTIRPWCVRIEQALNTALFFPNERGRIYAEHSLDALLRGDVASRYAAYAIGRQWGWYSANDIRERENLNPVEGGDIYLQPLNYTNQAAIDPAVEAVRSLPALANLEQRANMIAVPGWMVSNAMQGLVWHRAGRSGNVSDQTVDEAVEITRGYITPDKIMRMYGYHARHLSDLSVPEAGPEHMDYPSPGVVASALWGGGHLGEAQRAMGWAADYYGATKEFEADRLTEVRKELSPHHEGDVIAILRLAYDGLDVPRLAIAVRESLGADFDESKPTANQG